MAFQFLPRLSHRPFLISIPLGLSLTLLPSNPLFSPFRNHQSIRCDYGSTVSSHNTWSSLDQSPKSSSWGRISQSTVRQISLGSVLGLCAGIGLRIFSRALVLTLGLAILAVQWSASKGYNIIPVHWLQRRFKSIDFERAVTENVPFKSSFGLTMALSAFAEF
ncbi:hypothetical protein AJ80_08701 [Polytolypa hystricis UAMH7299]|uniref:FUN14 domain-containing protein n=1 Tax=Polytolypa hystricis (strain UAMH7299) TaxID=1447883 RepID=A0A2B7X3J0_POLH7|nr:hypothetical protein AJ80_08701 [Polytolypa hystricis UAMH7299]